MEKQIENCGYQIIFKDFIFNKEGNIFRLRICQNGKTKLYRRFDKKWVLYQGNYSCFYPEFNKWVIIKNNHDKYDKEILSIIKQSLCH